SGAASSALFAGGETPLDGLEVGVHLGIPLPQRLDPTHGAHHGGVIAVAEGAPQLREAGADPLTTQVHRHLPRERHALVPILAEELGVGEAEVIADGALDV